jgi:hypothetical protein
MSTTAFDRSFVNPHAAVSWRSTIAGLLISFLVFGILLSLGMALGGVSLTDGANLKNSGIIGAVWMLLSVLISVFVGSYFAGRISTFVSSLSGIAHGAVLCALFIGLVLWQFVGFAGWVTKSAASFVGGAVQMGAPAAQGAANQMDLGMNTVLEDRLGDVQFKGDPKTVMTGVATRLIQGNTDSAKNYLAANSNLSRAEIDTRINQLQTQVQQAGEDARQAAASALKVTGWGLFFTSVIGLIVACLGGLMGTAANRLVPVDRSEGVGMRTFRPAHT